MLNRGKLLLIFLIGVLSCENPNSSSIPDPILFSIRHIGADTYWKVYSNIGDSVKLWSLNNLGYYGYLGKSKNYFIDSTICFNKKRNRVVISLLEQQLVEDAFSDEISILFGENINGNWYFFESATSVTEPRELFKEHDKSIPLSYQQLHYRAMKDVYTGYLLQNGEINEKWFTDQFEGSSWGSLDRQEYSDWCFKGKRYTDIHEYYQACHLCVVKRNWMSRDTTKPIIPLPPKNLK